jgi:hypothetical protein
MIPVTAILDDLAAIGMERDPRELADRAESEFNLCRGFARPRIREPEAAKATGELPAAKTREIFPPATH